MDSLVSYDLSALLMFSPQVYYRQIELANQDVWPAQLIAVACGVLLALCISFPTALRNRVAAAVLAIAWLCSGSAFIASRFADIHIAGSYAVAVFFIQAAALTACAVTKSGLGAGNRSRGLDRIVATLVAAVVFVYPFLALISGRPFASAEVFGVAADPTALVTLLVISGTVSGWRLLLAAAPVIWLVFSVTTLWAMGSVEIWFVLPVLILAVVMLPLRLLRKPDSSTRRPG